MPTKLPELFIKNIRELLHRQRISQADLATRMGITRQSLQSLLTPGKLPRMDSIEAVADALAVPAFTLLMNESEQAQWQAASRPQGAVPGANAEDRLRALEAAQAQTAELLNRLGARPEEMPGADISAEELLTQSQKIWSDAMRESRKREEKSAPPQAPKKKRG